MNNRSDRNPDRAGIQLRLVLVAGLLMFLATGIRAQTTGESAYLTDQRGTVVRNAIYLCWHTGYWTPAAAIAECDPDLVPKPFAPPPLAAGAPPSSGAQAPAPAPKPAPAPPPAPAPVMQKVTLAAETLFDFDKSVVKPEGRRRLDELTGTLSSLNVDAIIAIGHSDSIGSDAYNLRLSMRRAQAVKSYLVSKAMPADRITAGGKGEKQPLAINLTREGRAKNRRVEVEVVGTERR